MKTEAVFPNAEPCFVYERLYRFLEKTEPHIYRIERCDCDELGVEQYEARLSSCGTFYILEFFLHPGGHIYISHIVQEDDFELWKSECDAYMEEAEDYGGNSC